jgi:hypothetical protein
MLLIMTRRAVVVTVAIVAIVIPVAAVGEGR